jgi:hypothetical protein
MTASLLSFTFAVSNHSLQFPQLVSGGCKLGHGAGAHVTPHRSPRDALIAVVIAPEIENCLHWQLDVTFGEDASRIQRRHAAENFAALRRMALGLLKRHSGKGGIATKRFEAALDTNLLEEILNGQ